MHVGLLLYACVIEPTLDMPSSTDILTGTERKSKEKRHKVMTYVFGGLKSVCPSTFALILKQK